MVGSNQRDYLENENACSKRTLKTHVATRLKKLHFHLSLDFEEFSNVNVAQRWLRSSNFFELSANDGVARNRPTMTLRRLCNNNNSRTEDIRFLSTPGPYSWAGPQRGSSFLAAMTLYDLPVSGASTKTVSIQGKKEFQKTRELYCQSRIIETFLACKQRTFTCKQ